MSENLSSDLTPPSNSPSLGFAPSNVRLSHDRLEKVLNTASQGWIIVDGRKDLHDEFLVDFTTTTTTSGVCLSLREKEDGDEEQLEKSLRLD